MVVVSVAHQVALLEGRTSSMTMESPPHSPTPRPLTNNAVKTIRNTPAGDTGRPYLTGERPEDFFVSTSRAGSRSPLSLTRNSSGLSSKSSRSSKSTRTVSSLRSAPAGLVDDKLDADWVELRRTLRSSLDGSPRSVVIPDIPDEEMFPVSIPGRPQDVSFLTASTAMSTPTRNSHDREEPSPPPRPPSSTAGSSDVSLSAADVKFFVKALKRVATDDDFSQLIRSIKNKRDPDFQCLSHLRHPHEQPTRQSRTAPVVETVHDSLHSDSSSSKEDEENGLDVRIRVTSALPTPVMTPETDKDENIESAFADFTSLSKPVELYEKGQNNSILASDQDDGSQSSASSACFSETLIAWKTATASPRTRRRGLDAGDHTPMAMSRKISFSTQDRVRLYDLTKEEIKQKRITDENDILKEARRRRQRRRMPGVFCMPGEKVNEATALLAKLYEGGVETAKGLRKKCEEKGWLKDVDGLATYFGNDSSPTTGNEKFCGVIYADPEPEYHTTGQAAQPAPVIQANESREGLQAPSGNEHEPKEQAKPESLPRSRSGASRRTKHANWIEISSSNPFRDQRSNSILNVSSLSFDSHAPSDEGNAVDEIMPPARENRQGKNFIHLLEIEEAEHEDDEGQEITRFEC